MLWPLTWVEFFTTYGAFDETELLQSIDAASAAIEMVYHPSLSGALMTSTTQQTHYTVKIQLHFVD